MYRILTVTLIALALIFQTESKASAQNYTATPVTISKEKVKNNGKIYYSHIVLEKQTLYSISKAYGVTVQEIIDANLALNLEKEGLKKDQIIHIPVKDGVTAAGPATESIQSSEPSSQSSEDNYFIHVTKWYEDLDSIAQTYGTTAEVLMQYNGLKTKTLKKKQQLKIPRDLSKLSSSAAKEEDNNVNEPEYKSVEFTTPEGQDAEIAEELSKLSNIASPKKVVSAVLMLPFNSNVRVSDDDMDFYGGALLAIRNLGNNGIGTDLNVYDVATSIPVTKERLAESDIIIGPSSSADINKVLTILPEQKYIISPMDLKCESIARENGGVIQKPTPLDSQYKDVVQWLSQDLRTSDKVVVISEKAAKESTTITALNKYLKESGLQYQSLSYGILQGRNITASLEGMMTDQYTNRVIIVSDSEAFVNDAVRNLTLLIHKKYDIALYAPAKIRSFETIDVDDFHKVNLHVSMSYYVDYDNQEVKDFLLSYRSLFNTEPSPFAYQGYDTANYFIKLCSKYGDMWPEMLPFEYMTGLQANFRFVATESDGFVNESVRRVVYDPDYSIRLVK